MMRDIGYQPSRAKSVLLKSSWAVVIEWVYNRERGFDNADTLLYPSNRRAWLRWYGPPLLGGFLPSAFVHQWYVNAKKRSILQGPPARETLANTVFLFYNNSMRPRGIRPLTPHSRPKKHRKKR